MVPAAAAVFTEACVTRLGSRLSAILLEGSFARDDEREHSDIDLFVLVDNADTVILDEIGLIVSDIETEHELNPAVVSVAELRAHPRLFEYSRIKLDGVVLFGALPEIELPAGTELEIAKSIARDVLMSSRHYLAVAESEEKFSMGKLCRWNLKPLGIALRFFHLAQTGEYVRSVRDLSALYPVLSLDPAAEWRGVIEECIVTCERIIGAY